MRKYLRRIVSVMIVMPGIASGHAAFGADLPAASLTVLAGQAAGAPANLMMQRYLLGRSAALLQEHRQRMLTLSDPAEIRQWQTEMRTWLVAAIGGLPPRDTPLHAQVTGEIRKSGYRVEKILLQSQPGFYVTAALFLPDDPQFKPPYPAVLVACGHSPNGKGLDVYQRGAALLAINGIAAFLFDPIDQGERHQLRDEKGRPSAAGTHAHNLLGIGSMLLGNNTSQFMIHDAIRCLDFLQSRPDIDASRLGMAGNSGGGTQTALVMSIDDRLKAAAPSCYITDFEHWLPLLAKRGDVPGDAEQNVAGQIGAGLNHWGFLTMRAPMPTLVCSAEQDFFPIAGTRASVEVARTVFERLGAGDRLRSTVAAGKHGWQQPLREATASWMLRWLAGDKRDVREPADLQVLSEKEIRVTTTGEVLDLDGARSTYDINQDRMQQLREKRLAMWKQRKTEDMLSEVRRVTSIRTRDQLRAPAPRNVGRIERDGYRIDQLILEPEPGIVLPALAFIPSRKTNGICLWLDEKGKSHNLAGIEKKVLAGQAVLAVDVRGLGETQGIRRKWYDIDDAHMVVAYMLGRSYTAMRAEDIIVAAQAAGQLIEGAGPVDLVARGPQVAVPALHAAAVERSLFGQVHLEGDLKSYEAIVSEPHEGTRQLVHVIHAALTVYDLPDLRSVVRPAK